MYITHSTPSLRAHIFSFSLQKPLLFHLRHVCVCMYEWVSEWVSKCMCYSLATSDSTWDETLYATCQFSLSLSLSATGESMCPRARWLQTLQSQVFSIRASLFSQPLLSFSLPRYLHWGEQLKREHRWLDLNHINILRKARRKRRKGRKRKVTQAMCGCVDVFCGE